MQIESDLDWIQRGLDLNADQADPYLGRPKRGSLLGTWTGWIQTVIKGLIHVLKQGLNLNPILKRL